MLDDLRNSSTFQEEEPQPPEQGARMAASPRAYPVRRRSREPFLGITPQQRFILALMLFFMVCITGALLLVIFEKIGLPF